MDVAETLVAQFAQMVRRDGGSIRLLSVDRDEIRVGYQMGGDAVCENGACVLPHIELQALMNETLNRRAPAMRVVVQLIS